MIEQDQLARASRVSLAEVRLEAALPVAVPERRSARRDGELPRHEVVVRDGIGGEMREVTERERVQRFVACLLADLEPDVPGVAVTPGRGVLLRDARVGRDGPVEKVVRKRGEQLRDRGG